MMLTGAFTSSPLWLSAFVPFVLMGLARMRLLAGVAAGLALPKAWHESHRAVYARSKARLVTGLEAAGFSVLPASGTWFVSIDLAASGLPADDVAVAERLIREAGVASIPVSAFYAQEAEKNYLRLCFAKQDAILDEAVERLARFRRGL